MKKLAAKAKKIVVGRCRSASNPKVTHTQYRVGKELRCSCVGFKTRRNCYHVRRLKGEKAMPVKAVRNSGKVVAPKGRTTHATMIGLLLKHKGKVVSIETIREAVSKVKGLKRNSDADEKRLEAKIQKRSKLVAQWLKARNLTLVKRGKGFIAKAA